MQRIANELEYQGRLGSDRGAMDSEAAQKAYRIYIQQVGRCSNKNNPSFKTYGARGVRVQYTARQFIGWYLKELSAFKGTTPAVGRIDHSKDYSFDNIEMVEMSNNAKERTDRLGPVTDRRPVLIFNNSGELHARASSVRDAAAMIGVQHGAVVFSCQHETKKGRCGFYFRYE